MAIKKGIDGQCKVNDTVLDVTAWTLSVSAGEGETTGVGDKDQEFEQTTRGATGSLTISFDETDAKQKEIIDMWLSGGTLAGVWLQLFVDSTNTKQWSFSAIITGFDAPVNANDIDVLTLNFKRTGAFFAVPSTV